VTVLCCPTSLALKVTSTRRVKKNGKGDIAIILVAICTNGFSSVIARVDTKGEKQTLYEVAINVAEDIKG
jgi:hypothetical protein